MASIASPIIQRRSEPEDEQLLKLFWNRAELKKELAKMRREKEKLLDQLRQQENVNLRAQQRFEQLESLLADPVQGSNAIVYYQLRGVWQHCRKRLARLARELADRQLEREDHHVRTRFGLQRDAELALLDDKLAEQAGRVQAREADLHALEERNRQLRGFWNHFRRRANRERAATLNAMLDGLRLQDDRLRAARREKELEPVPGATGLSAEGKRNINLAIIALAQQLVVQLAEHDVAGLAREAAVRSLADVSYGDVSGCQALSQAIESVVRRLDGGEGHNRQVRRRAEMLKAIAQFRRDGDTVPIAGSFSSIPFAVAESGEARPSDRRAIAVNVLADEYWDIYNVLLT